MIGCQNTEWGQIGTSFRGLGRIGIGAEVDEIFARIGRQTAGVLLGEITHLITFVFEFLGQITAIGGALLEELFTPSGQKINFGFEEKSGNFFVELAVAHVGHKGGRSGMREGRRDHHTRSKTPLFGLFQNGFYGHAVGIDPNGAIVGFDATGKSGCPSGGVGNQITGGIGFLQTSYRETFKIALVVVEIHSRRNMGQPHAIADQQNDIFGNPHRWVNRSSLCFLLAKNWQTQQHRQCAYQEFFHLI